jgi:hypothetical protein
MFQQTKTMHYIIVFILCLVSSTCYSQTITPFVINSTGNHIANANHTLDYSVGEIGISNIASKDNFITQGLLQSTMVSVPTSVLTSTSTSIDVFPNPTTSSDGFTIKTDEAIEKISVINALGQTEYFYTKAIQTSFKGLLIIFITTDKGYYTSKVEVY